MNSREIKLYPRNSVGQDMNTRTHTLTQSRLLSLSPSLIHTHTHTFRQMHPKVNKYETLQYKWPPTLTHCGWLMPSNNIVIMYEITNQVPLIYRSSPPHISPSASFTAPHKRLQLAWPAHSCGALLPNLARPLAGVPKCASGVLQCPVPFSHKEPSVPGAV